MNAEQSFINKIKSISDIPDEQIKEMFRISQLKKINKGDCFIREGEIPQNIGFVIKGLFRYYYLDIKGNDFTKGFFPENSFITSYSALIQNRESYYSIEAFEDSLVMIVNYNKWRKLVENNLFWNKLLLHFIENAYCTKEAREREFLLFDAETRYKTFLNTYPNLEKRIKQHLVASYIGISPVSLSRIRKKSVLLT